MTSLYFPAKVSWHTLRRTARKRARTLNHRLAETHIEQRPEWLRAHGLPAWVKGFDVESTARGPFGWKVVAVDRVVRERRRPS